MEKSVETLPNAEEPLYLLVDKVLKDLFMQVSNIELQCCSKYEVGDRDMCTVYTKFYGGYEGWIVLCAERTLMRRIVEQMLDIQVTDPLEIVEGVEEFFNIVCGHLVAAVFAATKLAAKFHSPCFVEGGYRLENADEKMIIKYYTNEYDETVSLLYDRCSEEDHKKENGGEKSE